MKMTGLDHITVNVKDLDRSTGMCWDLRKPDPSRWGTIRLRTMNFPRACGWN